MAITEAEARMMGRRRRDLMNNPGVNPKVREYIQDIDKGLGGAGADVLPTTTTSTTTTTTSTTTTSTAAG